MKHVALLVVCLAAVCVLSDASLSVLKQGWGPEAVTQHSGYITVNTKADSGGHLFFWLFESRRSPSTDPLVLWLTGGPGCSSELAIFYEQGPYRILNDSSIGSNPHSWNSVANVLFVDQPVGTGFSWGKGVMDYVSNEDQLAEDMYEFMQTFYEQFPQYKSLDFYVTGESYAGHYVPAIAHRILVALQNKEGPFDIPLKGFAIGNGLVNPILQYEQYAYYALDKKLINQDQFNFVNGTLYPTCVEVFQVTPFFSMGSCNAILAYIMADGLNFNTYDVRKKCDVKPLCYNFSNLDALVAGKEFRESLGVNVSQKWSECDTEVHLALVGDWMIDYDTYIPNLLKAGIRGLIYHGKEDFICNWYGGYKWVKELNFDGQDYVRKNALKPWSLQSDTTGATVGEFVSASGLSFVTVESAGHMVPMDQPEVALDMISRFITNTPFDVKVARE